ncbi:MAG: ABC transporter ATP-binding protein, partial [Rhodobacterales bacterium 32-66-7]
MRDSATVTDILETMTDTTHTTSDGLSVDGIGKTYGERTVVKSVSLQVGRGEVVGLLGPNGAGKTTCFYMITGLV